VTNTKEADTPLGVEGIDADKLVLLLGVLRILFEQVCDMFVVHVGGRGDCVWLETRDASKQTLNTPQTEPTNTSMLQMAPKRKSAPPTPESALEQLQQSQSLKILAIAETLSPKDLPQSAKKRSSVVSEDSEQNGDTHPAALEADLLHYKVRDLSPLPIPIAYMQQELFSKLRFSYVEQVTKEKFLRSITENPPRLVEGPENDEKEQEILALKASLKERKLEVAEILRQLEEKGTELSLRYEGLQLRTQQLESLPREIEGLEASIEQLKQEQTPVSDNPELALPLPETLQLVSDREAELSALNAQIASLQASLPNRSRELEKLERELKPLETQKNGTVAAAKEARRRKEEGGGIGDELEERGRWLTASEKALKDMLEV
jgi:hypothetical protein